MGTPAAEREPNDLSENKKRLQDIQSLLEDFQFKNNQSYLNKSCEVLVENKLNNQNNYFGRTKFMTPVKFDSENCIPGELIDIEITSFNRNALFGVHKIKKDEAA